ncbi:MarR family transcriptional regulator [Haloglomus salinum]|uniref:MarR family transcriptional regulator n=1 Tax=Haloglomus salinum TaxID=2962673 RepID=UPI0020C9EB2A|nr:helix-turn-helix domain-containing protein [Haloglomus salinum]
MPIDIERFEQGPPEELRAEGRTNAETILTFLASSPEQAFTPKEIHEATAVARGSVGVVLSRLEDRGLVRHRGDYWAISPDADVEKTISGMATARAVTERLGAEDPDEWGPGVEADTEDEPSE